MKITISRTLWLVQIAVLVAISIVLNSIKIDSSVGSISFSYIPSFIGGAFLGPLAGVLVGVIGDIVGVIFRGVIFNPFITLGKAFLGFIPGIIFKYLPLKHYFNTILSFIFMYLICTLLINTTAIYFYFIVQSGKTFSAYLLTRIVSQTPIVAINMAICLFLYPSLNRLIFKIPSKTYKKTKNNESKFKTE